ncbi:uncharacterized protein LOC123509532 [Portunus trituberculatus]|uniref:uncharacterized protein LOC123509532 n=1 Tax=Portunus trituberculatus TaxID=210409 RepID=UPI001E1D1C36|nr:uncharacterized protein LOC123509532 [Portunus trituberculatus]XP_045119821.1 uncharacterized protein LOC123509532 [Portunus trituberculatus]XP_045119822.1 uncharacterized protein LOC123509532 [Portunus trituberculatus]XP_045119823.1 uncharacterized protein LOC123509532 [Portunus trituberculatus]XP_045119824.1 uncharacterized protein LOC123509532 [Portunus trituberculatus]XP_045119825.1 uncharacterized protein LOC123509532 [Portunus trituberculatus]XP_045119826.1 uncharacterized protein LO
MAYQRRGKTYLSAVQKAERKAAEEAANEGENKRARRRCCPPRFSDLFINKKEKALEQSKENVGTKVEETFNLTSSTMRKPLGVNSTLANSTNSVPSFSDTFDNVFGKPSFATQPQNPKHLYSSTSTSGSTCEGHIDSSGVLFKSLLSTVSNMTEDSSSDWTNRLRNCKNNSLSNNEKIQPGKEQNVSLKGSQKPSIQTVCSPDMFASKKPSIQPVCSPDMFASIDKIADTENEISVNTPPAPKTRTLRQTTRKKALCRQRTSKINIGDTSTKVHRTKNTLGTERVADVKRREPPSSQFLVPNVQPSPLVQRFLNSLGITRTPLVQSSPAGLLASPHVSQQSGSPPVTGKSTGKSSVHTSTPTEQSKWSGQGSSSLDIRVSPVPREEDVVTDNSSDFQSPSLPIEINRGQSPGDLGGSPSLPSKYETCASSGRFREDSNQQYVTGETCNSEKEKSPNIDSSSIKISQKKFKSARIPKMSFESPPQQKLTAHGTEPASDQILFDSYSSIIIETRGGKAAKMLESSQISSSTQSPKGFIVARNGKRLSPCLAKRFSPKVTRSQSKLLGFQSDGSHNTDLSNCISISSCASDQRSWSSKDNNIYINLQTGNVRQKESIRFAAQETESHLHTDESTVDFIPPYEISSVLKRKRTLRSSFVSRRGMRKPLDLPPIARKSLRIQNKRKSVKVSIPIRRSSRLLVHNHNTSRASSQEASTTHVSSDCSSIINFRPIRRRNDHFIFHRWSSTITSLDSWPDSSHAEPPVPVSTNQHTEETEICEDLKDSFIDPKNIQNASVKEIMASKDSHLREGNECSNEYSLKEVFVRLVRLENERSTRKDVRVFSPLPSLSVKPGKGWRRSIAIRARAMSLASAEDSIAMRPPANPSRSPEPCRKMSGLRMASFPLELNHGHHMPFTDSPRRSALQMSFCVEDVDLSAPPIPPTDPRQKVLELCSQEHPLPLTHCFTDSRLACCRKIGEGVYGEVFMTQPDAANLVGATVLKIMPIEGDFLVNGEPQKKFEEILSEMVISMELSGLREPERQRSITENFVHVQGSWCVEGRYPHDLLHLWDLYNEEKNSENDRPDIFPDTQLYVVLEFGHGGRDLEGYVFNNARDLMAVFLQIAYSLAVAEEALEFEHRDLHWGNVLVAQTVKSKINFKLRDKTYSLNTYGLKGTVIDFTLSRIKLPHCSVFNNLAEDPSLFTSEGDYQFEVYRLMQQANNNTWEKFTPYTNVLWLHYLLVKMTSQCYIKNKKTKLHRTHHMLLTKLRDDMLNYESATQFVLSRESE